MIYIKRDWSKVPQKVKNDLEAAAAALEKISDQKTRKQFIAKKANQKKWTALREFLYEMSFGKCWYSEARDSVARLQVDHFRPHGRVKQASKNFELGYCWLAFELENFRLAGQLCNTVNKEHSTDAVGKGEWFPLLDPSKRATLGRRLFRAEKPILLDPTVPGDPDKLTFLDDGTVSPAADLDKDERKRVKRSITLLGLKQSALNQNRGAVWAECKKKIMRYQMLAIKQPELITLEEEKIMKEDLYELAKMSKSSSPFSSVARCCLTAHLLSYLIVRDELPMLTM